MKLKETAEFSEALRSLTQLKEELGRTPELQAIASFFMVAADCDAAEPRFRYVGDRSDPRDRAVVQAYLDAWENFVAGDDDDD